MAVALTDYRAALDYLFARTTGASRLGLDRTLALLARLGDPHLRVPALHVAGTNGKGSVAATLDALLRARGRRVGRYTSPHLVDFRERIVVDGAPIPEAEVVEFVERWTPECERLGATFFEATTALAFEHFARAGADVAVVETGLGGRLDSTNVVRPHVAGVTSIGLDHMEYLGDTLEAIALEKAGIFKAGCPAVIGEPDERVRGILSARARELGARPVRLVAEESRVSEIVVTAAGTTFDFRSPFGARSLHTPLAGRHQAGNAATALTMLDAAGPDYALPLDAAADALGDVRLPGRFDRQGKYIFDVAHNPDGARTLAETLAATSPPAPLAALLCILRDKDWRTMIDVLAPRVDVFVVTDAPTAPASRTWSSALASEYAAASGRRAVHEPDFERALARATAEGRTVLITGSFHTVGDAMVRLQVSPFGG